MFGTFVFIFELGKNEPTFAFNQYIGIRTYFFYLFSNNSQGEHKKDSYSGCLFVGAFSVYEKPV